MAGLRTGVLEVGVEGITMLRHFQGLRLLALVYGNIAHLFKFILSINIMLTTCFQMA